jgi:uncharacterized protein YigA (DUF484 family)
MVSPAVVLDQAAMQEPAEQNAQMKDRLADATKALAQEHKTSAALRRIIAELDLELQQARDYLEHAERHSPSSSATINKTAMTDPPASTSRRWRHGRRV